MVETALIYSHSRAGEQVFGKSLLERNLELCADAGIKRFFIACDGASRDAVESALGAFRNHSNLVLLDSFDHAAARRLGLPDSTPCAALDSNLVFTRDQLLRLIQQYGSTAMRVVRLASTGGDAGAGLSVGTLGDLIGKSGVAGAAPSLAGLLPFALDGRPDDPAEAERRIASTLRHETAWKDGFLAHHLDRHISWRIALILAHTSITPNQVTVANTVLGLAAAAVIACAGYWPPVIGTLMMLLSVTIDGVDGELARMKLAQSEYGGKLDAVTDLIVNIATFTAIGLAAYRNAGPAIARLFPFFVIGCVLSAAVAYRIVSTAHGKEALSLLEKHTSRDNVYAFFLFALLGRLDLLVWVATIGSFVFPIAMWFLSARRNPR